MKYNQFIKNFFGNNKVNVLTFLIVSSIILPIQSIGFSGYITKIILNIRNKNYQIIYSYLLIIIGIYLVIRILNSIQYYFEIKIYNNILEELRNDMFQSTINKYKKRYQEIEVGKLISYFTIIPDLYQELSYKSLRLIIPYILSITILLFYFFYVDIRLGILIGLFLFSIIILIYCLHKKSVQYNSDKYNDYHKINEKLQDRMSNIFSILTNGQDKYEIFQQSKLERKNKLKGLKANTYQWKLDTILNLTTVFFFILSILLYFYLFQKKTNNTLLISSFIVFFYLIEYINNSLWYVVDYFNLVGIIKDYEHSLKIKDKINKFGNKMNFINKGIIQLHSIQFEYHKHKKIHEKLNMIFYPNQITTILGKSGSGKSTIIKIILGLIPPSKGKITIDNVNIIDSSSDYLRSNISIVSQDVKLFNNNILNNIKYGNLNTSTYKIIQIIKQLKLNDNIFQNLPNGIYTNCGVNGSMLSNGQRQIILILRAYLQNRKILILDEPTSSLDINTKKTVLDLIKKISIHKTTIIVTHDKDVKDITDKFYNL